MNMTRHQIDAELRKRGWTGSMCQWVGGHNNYEIRNWNSFDNCDDAYEWFKRHRGAMFASVKAEFQAKQRVGVCYCGKCCKCMYG